MRASPSLCDASVRRYILQLSLRTSGALRSYRRILSSFQCSVGKAGTAPLSLTAIQDWLRDHASLRPVPAVLHDARLVDRFLDWAVATRLLQSNPLAELRNQYLQRTTTPIVRALLNPDSTVALEALRPLPRFGSFLGATMRDYVALMKSVGHRYTTEERGPVTL